MLKYENSFWDNPGPGQQPRYERGPQCLYEKLEQGGAECDELLAFFRERMAIEEAYAASLRKLAERKLSAEGFGRDEGATLKTAFRGLLTECVVLAEAHADLALELQSSVIVPLRSFSSEHRARVRASWKLIDDTVRRASAELAQVDRNHRVYTQKASAAEQLRLKESPGSLQPAASPTEFEVKARPSLAVDEAISAVSSISIRSVEDEADADVALQRQLLSGGSTRALPAVHGELDVASIVLGNVALTRHEFHVMLQRMQTEVPQHDVRFGILGTFRGLISGESLAGWWCANYPTVVRNEADAVSVGQSMLAQGYLRFMGRGSPFQSRANAYYQWKRPALEFQSDDEGDSDNEALGSRQALLGRAVSYERARLEADEASQIYRDSVARAEVVRTGLEEQLTNYLDTMEVWELNRLMNVKSTLAEYARIAKQPVQAELAIGDRLEVYEESVKPQQDIQWGIENYGTGRFTPRPILFRPFALSPAEFQIFGVPLDEQLLVSHKDIPLLPAKALSLIAKCAREMAPEDRYAIWTARVLLRNVHELRNAVNRAPRVTLRQLRAFELPVVANVLMLYLLELPQPLCPEELHGPLRALYSSRSEKSSAETLKSVQSLLAGISYAHIKTLQTLFAVLREIAQGDASEARDEFVRAISRRLGPVIMRSKEIIGVSRIPELFAADLIEHYDVVLAEIDVARPYKPVPPPAKTSGEGAATPQALRESAAAAAAAVEAQASGSSVPVPRTSQPSESRTSEAPADGASKRSSGLSTAPDSAGTEAADKKPPTSFDDDERLIADILEDAKPGTAADSMDYFLQDESEDGSDDDDDDEGSTAGIRDGSGKTAA
ncbi:Rho-GTPase-activating protein 8 [Coemansia sp. RSA 2611]|nr:Rho-GTPase-activating protein 8 [Coemansia sp. RSA 2611]